MVPPAHRASRTPVVLFQMLEEYSVWPASVGAQDWKPALYANSDRQLPKGIRSRARGSLRAAAPAGERSRRARPRGHAREQAVPFRVNEVGRPVLPVCVPWNPIPVDPAAGMVAL